MIASRAALALPYLPGIRIARALGQPVVLDNRAGDNDTAGTEHVANAAPDGQTLLVYSTSAAAVNPHLIKPLSHDLLGSFAPIGFVAEMPCILVVGSGRPMRDLAGFVAFLRPRGGGATFASADAASVVAVSLLAQSTDTKVQTSPQRGGPETLTEAMAGRVDATFTDLGPGLALAGNGKVRALGVTTREPFAPAPDLPPLSTVTPGYDLTVWYGIAALAGTPHAVVTAAAQALATALSDAELGERLAAQGYVPLRMPPEQMADFLPRQFALWDERVKCAGIQPP